MKLEVSKNMECDRIEGHGGPVISSVFNKNFKFFFEIEFSIKSD